MSLLSRKQKRTFAMAVAFLYADEEPKKRKRRTEKSWLQKRETYTHVNLLKELREDNPDDFKNYLRMNSDVFDELLHMVEPYLKKQETPMRTTISPQERLLATLRFLATGRSYEDLKYSTAISAQALGYIIPETCAVIYDVLRKEYLKVRKYFLNVLGNYHVFFKIEKIVIKKI